MQDIEMQAPSRPLPEQGQSTASSVPARPVPSEPPESAEVSSKLREYPEPFLGPYTVCAPVSPDADQQHTTESQREEEGHDGRRGRRKREEGRGGRAGGPKTGVFRRDAICGMRRQMFWIIMAIGTFTVVATVGIGVGLGIACLLYTSPSPRDS